MYLLTGGSGVLGTELQKHLKCFAPSSKEFNIAIPQANVPWTWNSKMQTYLMNTAAPIKGIINCAAYTDVPGAETNRLDAIKLNIEGAKNVKHYSHWYASLRYGSRNVDMYPKTIYISTDYVYEGEEGNYTEDSQPKPFNFYGFTKLAGEAYMDDMDLIIRTSFKPNVEWPFPKAFTDLYTSADYVDVISKRIADLIESGATGVYNVGTDKKSIYELAKSRNPDVLPMSRGDITNVKLPKDISMDITKFSEKVGA